VWEFISGLLKDPEMLREGLEKMIEAEREGMRGDPGMQDKAWLERIAEVDRKRSRFQDMAAEGYITLDELGAKLRELNETGETAECELRNLEQRRARVEELEQDKVSLFEEFADRIPEAIEELKEEE
jgi:DNA repair ATPase RecN